MPSFDVEARYLNDKVKFTVDAIDTKGALQAARTEARNIFSFQSAPGVSEPTVSVKPTKEAE